MAIKIKETEEKVTAAKKTISFEDILVGKMTLVDTNGEDLTEQFKDALPVGTDTISFKVTVELPAEEDADRE